MPNKSIPTDKAVRQLAELMDAYAKRLIREMTLAFHSVLTAFYADRVSDRKDFRDLDNILEKAETDINLMNDILNEKSQTPSDSAKHFQHCIARYYELLHRPPIAVEDQLTNVLAKFKVVAPLRAILASTEKDCTKLEQFKMHLKEKSKLFHTDHGEPEPNPQEIANEEILNMRRNPESDIVAGIFSILIPIIAVGRSIYSKYYYDTWSFWKPLGKRITEKSHEIISNEDPHLNAEIEMTPTNTQQPKSPKRDL